MTEESSFLYAEGTIRTAGDNVIQPFQLESSALRGRVVSLGSVLDDILRPHKYPRAVGLLLGEAALVCVLLSSMLKYEGIFTLQIKGDGPVSLLVADMTSAGDLRACASFDADKLPPDNQEDTAPAQLLGTGHMAFTVDQGNHTDRYQGIVALNHDHLVDAVQHYFQQSEQIRTSIVMACAKNGKKWRAGGIMLQHMPEDGGPAARAPAANDPGDEDWIRAMTLMKSCTDTELLNSDLIPAMLLRRLFHEEGVRVFEPQDVKKGCRCSRERVESIVMMMSDEDRADMVVDSAITLTCEFCNKDFAFDPQEIASKLT